MPKNTPIKIIKKIRKEVRKEKSKIQVSHEFGLSYKKVLRLTSDIKKRGISPELRKKIRNEVKSGRSKRQTASDILTAMNGGASF